MALPAPLGYGRATYQSLQDERDELKERVRQLMDLLRGSDEERSVFVDALRMTATEAKFLGVLLHRPHPRKEDLFQSAWGDHACPPDDGIVTTLICKMRPKLAIHGIHIKTVWGIGYEMDAENKSRLRQFLENWDRPRIVFPPSPNPESPSDCDCL